MNDMASKSKSFIHAYFSLVKKFIPDDKSQSYIGLDIGAGGCKMVELAKKGDSFELLSWVNQPVEGGDLKKAIQDALSQAVVPVKSPVTAIFGKGTLIRFIEMPKMGLDDLKNSFALEADKYFPFPQDQIYTDCHIIGDKGDNNKMEVLVAAAKKEIVDERISMLTELDIQVDCITLNAIAGANLIQHFGQDIGDSVSDGGENYALAMLDMGEQVSTLTIVMNSRPRFTRDIFIGGKDLTRSISMALDIGFEEAEKLKLSPGKKQTDVISACETTVSNMVSELRLSMDYFMTENNATISQLLLTGGGAVVPGLPEHLGQSLEMDAVAWNPFDKVLKSENINNEELKLFSAQLATALGLALTETA